MERLQKIVFDLNEFTFDEQIEEIVIKICRKWKTIKLKDGKSFDYFDFY